ncbi:MAG: type II toxin-antitoxin system RelE/ParE family toxin [Defluviitaleaceae bacterium]|nr:type II toxin-antitoxin system RelE/ParE family toxin [Defluviitaleaceae bacterium]MCL2274019.1 type II toxin-antitoxin system RelE/ParE family toxin [Defluviitaleaceae bacterium]MCL2274080.1 type II toxin-antitoxin system RelE/ParE family toxin [Defluviitaleaceae bacterium]
MIYNVKLTKPAKHDLRDIYEYIARTLLEPAIAKNVIRRIWNELKTLEHMPSRYVLHPEEPWKSKELRRMNIGNYSTFYLVAGNDVYVMRIMYGGRDINTILNENSKENL